VSISADYLLILTDTTVSGSQYNDKEQHTSIRVQSSSICNRNKIMSAKYQLI